jgi:hypothetical protein
MVTDGACLSTKPKFAPRWQFNPAESINGFLPIGIPNRFMPHGSLTVMSSPILF